METEVLKAGILDRVEKALESIRPYLVADGGDVRLVEVTEDMEVKLELLGNCGTCPMSAMTLKAGVEESIRKFVPEIKAVTAISSL